jgi:hypothetical protein
MWFFLDKKKCIRITSRKKYKNDDTHLSFDKVSKHFFQKKIRFGNKTPDSLHFTKKMTENFGIEQVQL